MASYPPGTPYPDPSYYAGGSPGQHHHHHNQYPGGAGVPPPPPPPPPHGHGGSAGYAPAGYSGGGAPAYGGGGGPAPAMYVAPPAIEMQPWARNVWKWLARNTTGVARVDLRRPTPPLPEQYDGNLLVVRSRQAAAAGGSGGGRFGRKGRQPAAQQPQYVTPMYGQVVQYPGAPQPMSMAPPSAAQPLLMGARIKITRSFLIGGAGRRGATLFGLGGRKPGDRGDSSSSSSSDEPEVIPPAASPSYGAAPGAAPGSLFRRLPKPKLSAWAQKPLIDLGIGFNMDIDAQRVEPVARIKIKDLISIKAVPTGVLKISRSLPLGPVSLKVRYELPLAHAHRFWEPPARLMVRLDNAVGSGVHLTPGGVEFDEQVLRFGTAVSLRASAGLSFPRQLPLQEGEPPLRLQVHRLSLKSIW